MRYLILFCLALSPGAFADWKLDAARSSITYLSTKIVAGAHIGIFEPNRFHRFSANITDGGAVRVVIDLDSVDTGVAIRDERVKEHAFAVARYPRATVSLSLPQAARRGLAPGESTLHDLSAELDLRGQVHPVGVKMRITGLDDGGLLVQTVEPILVDAKAYGMLDGFETLRALVGLFKIPTTIPVSVNMVFAPS